MTKLCVYRLPCTYVHVVMFDLHYLQGVKQRMWYKVLSKQSCGSYWLVVTYIDNFISPDDPGGPGGPGKPSVAFPGGPCEPCKD